MTKSPAQHCHTSYITHAIDRWRFLDPLYMARAQCFVCCFPHAPHVRPLQRRVRLLYPISFPYLRKTRRTNLAILLPRRCCSRAFYLKVQETMYNAGIKDSSFSSCRQHHSPVSAQSGRLRLEQAAHEAHESCKKQVCHKNCNSSCCRHEYETEDGAHLTAAEKRRAGGGRGSR